MKLIENCVITHLHEQGYVHLICPCVMNHLTNVEKHYCMLIFGMKRYMLKFLF